MRKFFCSIIAVIAACSPLAAQDDSEQRLRRALEGRLMSVKMDLPAIDLGVNMVFDDDAVSFDQGAYNKLVKDYGVALRKGSQARITGVRVTARGIEIDLDGGGSPGRDWAVGGHKLVEPLPQAKSQRETDLERLISAENTMASTASLRSELEDERQRRLAQDDRNREAFERAAGLRREYIEKNRKSWGSRLIVVVRSRKDSVSLRDMARSLAKYVELMPRETPGQ